ncbi:MAG: hypothetical protein ACP5N3_02140 [Candidatus Nanoarchaeia archaeon]
MGKSSKKTIQIGLRIDEELLKKIESLSEYEGVDKMAWMRRALASFVNGEEQAACDEAIENYVHLRITEEQFLTTTKMTKVPKDIEQARKEVLASIKKGSD